MKRKRGEEKKKRKKKKKSKGMDSSKELCMKVWNMYRNAMILYGNYLGKDFYGFLWILVLFHF